MLNVLGLGYYSSTELMAMLLIFGIGSAVLGFITDAVMGERGFGPFGNGFLTVLGASIGIHYRLALLGPVGSRDIILVGISAAASATVMLLILGVVKRYVH